MYPSWTTFLIAAEHIVTVSSPKNQLPTMRSNYRRHLICERWEEETACQTRFKQTSRIHFLTLACNSKQAMKSLVTVLVRLIDPTVYCLPVMLAVFVVNWIHEWTLRESAKRLRITHFIRSSMIPFGYTSY